MPRRGRSLLITALTVLCACGSDDELRIDVPSTTPTPAVAIVDPTLTPTITRTPTAPPPTDTATTTVTPSATPTTTPVDATRFVGVYDDAAGFPGLGVVTLSDAKLTLFIPFNGHTSFALTGASRADGTVDLSGTGVVEDDELVTIDGTAALTESQGIQQVVSTFQNHNGFPFQISVDTTLRRPAVGTSSQFGRSYRFTFAPSPSGCECTTSAVIAVTIDANGLGQAITTEAEQDESGTVIGRFDLGDCAVSPLGAMRCTFVYTTTFRTPRSSIPPTATFNVTLSGSFGSGAASTGSGRTEAAIFPEPFFLGGDWTATSVTTP